MESGATPTEQTRGTMSFEQPYTVVLIGLGVVALFSAFSLQLSADMATADTELTSSQFGSVIRFAQIACGFLAAAYFVAGALRVRGSPYARSSTALLSVVSIGLFPFGTAAFVYWLGWVRKREIAPQAS